MEPEKEKAHEEAMKHMKRATEHLKDSLAIHEAEMAGHISPEEAMPVAIAFNEMAGKETDLATEAIRDFLGEGPKPPAIEK